MTQTIAIRYKGVASCRQSKGYMMKKKIAHILSIAVVNIALFIIGILAIPVCVSLVPVMIVWTFTDKIVRLLERE